jgi:preprotein translocase subunit SecG
MDTLETVLLILLAADALALAVLILLQQGKGADIGAAFGSGGANTVFGSAGGASFLMKLTTWLAIGFFLVTFGLAYTAKERAGNIRGIGMPDVSSQTTIQEEVTPSLSTPLDEANPDPLAPQYEQIDSEIPDV